MQQRPSQNTPNGLQKLCGLDAYLKNSLAGIVIDCSFLKIKLIDLQYFSYQPFHLHQCTKATERREFMKKNTISQWKQIQVLQVMQQTLAQFLSCSVVTFFKLPACGPVMVYAVGVPHWKIQYARHSKVQILFWKSNKDGPEKEIRQLAQMKQSTGPKIKVMLGNPCLSPPCSLENTS